MRDTAYRALLNVLGVPMPSQPPPFKDLRWPDDIDFTYLDEAERIVRSR